MLSTWSSPLVHIKQPCHPSWKIRDFYTSKSPNASARSTRPSHQSRLYLIVWYLSPLVGSISPPPHWTAGGQHLVLEYRAPSSHLDAPTLVIYLPPAARDMQDEEKKPMRKIFSFHDSSVPQGCGEFRPNAGKETCQLRGI